MVALEPVHPGMDNEESGQPEPLGEQTSPRIFALSFDYLYNMCRYLYPITGRSLELYSTLNKALYWVSVRSWMALNGGDNEKETGPEEAEDRQQTMKARVALQLTTQVPTDRVLPVAGKDDRHQGGC